MIPSHTLTLGLLFLLSAPLPSAPPSAQTQTRSPSAATLIEQARILAEEKANPKAAITLLVDKIICRSDLTKAQFDKASKMIAVYGGGKPPALSAQSAETPLPRQDLTRLIEKEIDAYLSRSEKSERRIEWYGKAALPILISRLKRDYLNADVAYRLVPLIVSAEHPNEAAVFLRELRERGPERFRRIVAEAIRWGWAYEGEDVLLRPLMEEILVWIRTRKEGEGLLRIFWQEMRAEDLMLLLTDEKPKCDPIRVVKLLTSRHNIDRLKDPRPLFRIVLQEAKKKQRTGKKSGMFGPYLLPWLIRQKGGFEVLAKTIGASNRFSKAHYDSLSRSLGSFPDLEEGLKTVLSTIVSKSVPDSALAFLEFCLRKAWIGQIEQPSSELQSLLLNTMEILDKGQREGYSTNSPHAQLKGLLLLRVTSADPAFQESLWVKAIGFRRSPKLPFFLKLPANSIEYWGVASLLLYGSRGERPVISSRMSGEARQRLYLLSLTKEISWYSRHLFAFESDEYVFPEASKKRLLQALTSSRKPQMVLLRSGITEWWTQLSKPMAKSVMEDLLSDSSVSDTLVAGLLEEAIKREDDSLAFLKWVRSKRRGISLYKFLVTGIRHPSKEYLDVLIDWIQEDPSLTGLGREQGYAMDRFMGQLRRFPSKKGKLFLGTWLVSDQESVRTTARQILDDWKRIAASQAQLEDEEFKAALWRKTGFGHGVAVRTLALKGLFDLGEKKAWLVLTDWLESKDEALKKAAEELASEIRSGK